VVEILAEDGVQPLEVGSAVDEAAHVSGQLRGDGHIVAAGTMEVDAAGNVAGLDDVAGVAGKFRTGPAGHPSAP
jgi:hypothetical protein